MAVRTKLTDLIQDPKNARAHSERNLSVLQQGIEDVGLGRSVVLAPDNTIIAGNATVLAAIRAGKTKLKIVDSDGETLVAVRRSDLTDENRRTKLAVLDNRASELAEWDTEQLQALIDEGFDASEFWTDEELDKLLVAAEDPIAPEGFKEVDENIETEHQCPKCGYEWSGKAK